MEEVPPFVRSESPPGCRNLVVSLIVLGLVATRGFAGDLPAVTRQLNLAGPGELGTVRCEVVQMIDAEGEPSRYFMDVGSVVCAEAKCEVVTVRIHFDALGNYERYELPSGGNLTKLGHKPFSPADHEKLHEILSDPYSPLKSIEWSQITVPKGSGPGAGDAGFDAVSGATALSKRSMVVVGAAYTCCTLWHWSHGEAGKVMREMTVEASDKVDLLRYLKSERDAYAIFAIEQFRTRKLFDPESIGAVVDAVRRGSVRLVNPALSYLAEASSATGADHFFASSEDACLGLQPEKRVRFLETLREGNQKIPPACLARLSRWLARADSYYEVHLLLTLLEREQELSEESASGALSLLESTNALVVRRSYRYLTGRTLTPAQQAKLEAFEQENPDP